jgi:methyl-accepting chemotaxis protein
MWQHLNSLRTRLSLLLVAAGVVGGLILVGVTHWPLPQMLAWLHGGMGQDAVAPTPTAATATAAVPVPVPMPPQDLYVVLAVGLVLLVLAAIWLAGRALDPVSRLLRALEGAVASYRDGDFSFSIAANRRDELGKLIRMHNELGHTLREQRQHLAQRELLLDTVVQNTPVALVLTDASGRVAYANIASRHLFNEGRSLAGLDFTELLAEAPQV